MPGRPFTWSTYGVGSDGEPYEEIRNIRPGRHFTEHVADVKLMKRDKDYAGAVALLERVTAHLWTPAPGIAAKILYHANRVRGDSTGRQ